MNFAPAKLSLALVKDSLGFTRSSVNSVAWLHLLSSKSTANQSAGTGVCSTLGFFTSPLSGPLKKLLAFHFAFVTVPSENFTIRPASPIWSPYSRPVLGSALSRPMMAIVIGYSGRMSTDTTLCGM